MSSHFIPQTHILWTNTTVSNQAAREKCNITKLQLEKIMQKFTLFMYNNYMWVNKKLTADCKMCKSKMTKEDAMKYDFLKNQ